MAVCVDHTLTKGRVCQSNRAIYFLEDIYKSTVAYVRRCMFLQRLQLLYMMMYMKSSFMLINMLKIDASTEWH